MRSAININTVLCLHCALEEAAKAPGLYADYITTREVGIGWMVISHLISSLHAVSEARGQKSPKCATRNQCILTDRHDRI